MRAGNTYKHIECTDAAILVLKVQYHDQKRVKVRVSWVNVVNPTNVFPMGLVETIEIRREDLSKWKAI